MSDLESDDGNDAVSVSQDGDSEDSVRQHGTDSDSEDGDDDQGRVPGLVPLQEQGHQEGNPLLLQACRDHDTDFEDDCSECQEVQNVANNYQVGEAPLVDPAMSCTGDSGQVVDDTDQIPSLLARHIRTDHKEDTLQLDPQVLELAKQRLGEGQYESAAKFAKLVDKVRTFLVEDLNPVISD